MRVSRAAIAWSSAPAGSGDADVRAGVASPEAKRTGRGVDHGADGQGGGDLDQGTEFPDVAGPGASGKPGQGVRRELPVRGSPAGG